MKAIFSINIVLILQTSLVTVDTNSFKSLNKISEPGIGLSTCGYHELTTFLHQLVAKYTKITRLTSVGKSVEGRDIWVVILSDNPHNRPLLRPQVKFVGNIIGNQGPSCYVLLRLIAHLVKTYEAESSLERRLLEMNEIHILPNMNPDGFMRSAPGACSGGQGRYNARGYDLNRDFPDIFYQKSGRELQPETMAVINWIRNNSFMLSVSLISGALVVSYPFDSAKPSSSDLLGYFKNEMTDDSSHLTPDNDMFQHLAKTYVSYVDSSNYPDGRNCPGLKKRFENGIVNGAEWLPTSGTMLDFNYIEGVFEIMVGVTCCRNENNDHHLDNIWDINKQAILSIVTETEFGLRGQIIDSETAAPIPDAILTKHSTVVEQNGIHKFLVPWKSTQRGEFWRLILPGSYILQVEAKGYKTLTVPFEVKPYEFTTLIIELENVTTAEFVNAFEESVLISELYENSYHVNLTFSKGQINDISNGESAEEFQGFEAMYSNESRFFKRFTNVQIFLFFLIQFIVHCF